MNWSHIRLLAALALTAVMLSLGVACGSVTADPSESAAPDGQSEYSTPGFDTKTDLQGGRVDVSYDQSSDASSPDLNKVDSGWTLYDATNAMTAWCLFNLTREGAYIVNSEYSEDFRYGDYLLSINGELVTSAADAQRLLDTFEIGETVTVEVVRAKTEMQNDNSIVSEEIARVELTLREYVPEETDVRFDVQP
jgi:S1-C subfamily serine protease